jgi:hypothetical protein
MRDEERVAHEVADKLRAVGIEAVAKGEGVHWRVSAGDADTRSIVVHCFWYEQAANALMLGMNPSNARASLRPPVEPYEGLELAVDFVDDRITAANGRTRDIESFLVAVRQWIGGAKLEELVAVAPFVDARKRASRSVAAYLDRELGDRVTWHASGAPTYELWAYSDTPRACRVLDGVLGLYVGQVQVALGIEIADIQKVIAAWLIAGASLAELASLGMQIERHAEMLEVDPARWHWLHVRDRIADPDDVLAPLAPLITRLAASPIASRFYTYSSLMMLCFSASSHYPWVGSFPAVGITEDGTIRLFGHAEKTETKDLGEAVSLIETALAASPLAPFFGSEADYELPALVAAFARANSHHIPTLVRRQQWTDLGVVHGSRRCTFSGSVVTCIDGDKRSMHQCTSLDAAVSIAIAFLGA